MSLRTGELGAAGGFLIFTSPIVAWKPRFPLCSVPHRRYVAEPATVEAWLLA